jgi:hypothetical protein
MAQAIGMLRNGRGEINKAVARQTVREKCT